MTKAAFNRLHNQLWRQWAKETNHFEDWSIDQKNHLFDSITIVLSNMPKFCKGFKHLREITGNIDLIRSMSDFKAIQSLFSDYHCTFEKDIVKTGILYTLTDWNGVQYIWLNDTEHIFVR